METTHADHLTPELSRRARELIHGSTFETIESTVFDLLRVIRDEESHVLCGCRSRRKPSNPWMTLKLTAREAGGAGEDESSRFPGKPRC